MEDPYVVLGREIKLAVVGDARVGKVGLCFVYYDKMAHRVPRQAGYPILPEKITHRNIPPQSATSVMNGVFQR